MTPETKREEALLGDRSRFVQLLENRLNILPATLCERVGPYQPLPFSARHFAELRIELVIDVP